MTIRHITSLRHFYTCNTWVRFAIHQTDIFLQRESHCEHLSAEAWHEHLVWCNCMYPSTLHLSNWLEGWLAWNKLHLCEKHLILTSKIRQLHEKPSMGNSFWSAPPPNYSQKWLHSFIVTTPKNHATGCLQLPHIFFFRPDGKVSRI